MVEREILMSIADMSNGMTASELFGQASGWTFDDINVLPPHSEVAGRNEISLKSQCAKGFILNLPIISSPMDTVTEWRAAVEVSLQGGIGIIHMNLSPSVAAEQVRRVKRYQMGIVDNPVCRRPSDPLSEVDRVKSEFGFSTILITEDGTPNTKLLGMVTKGHVALEPDKSISLERVMIPRAKLMTVSGSHIRSWSEALEFLRREPAAHKLPVMKEDGSVSGFITRRDVVKIAQCPHALLDQETGQLRVGAAVSTHDRDDERVVALIEAGVDVLVVDSAQGSTGHAVRRISQIRQICQTIPIIAGNVVTPSQAEPLIRAGASALRVGMGSGSICTTQGVLGIGRAQLSAIYHVAHYAQSKGLDIPVIADGGIRSSGDIIKALVCGASAVMVGRLIAGCDETPSAMEEHKGRRYKRYRGMGSLGALEHGGKYRYGNSLANARVIPQGIEGLVPSSGSLGEMLLQMGETLQIGLEYLGCNSISSLHKRVENGDVRFELRSMAAREEGKPHDIIEG